MLDLPVLETRQQAGLTNAAAAFHIGGGDAM
jgi:hypothetical protein